MLQTTTIKAITGALVTSAGPLAAYTSPDANTSAIVKSFILFNTDPALTITVQVWVAGTGDANQIAEVSIDPKQPFVWDKDILVPPLAALNFKASTNAKVSVNGMLSEFATVS